MTTSAKHLSADDFWNLPDHGGRNELVHGELRAMSPTNFEHGRIAMLIGAILTAHVRKNRLGEITAAETGYRLDEHTVLAPDVAFVARHRVPAQSSQARYFPGAPDLAVEVLSPSDSAVEVEEKVAAFTKAGSQLVWIVNARRKTITVYRKDGTVTVLKGADALPGESLIPGFSCSLAEIFED